MDATMMSFPLTLTHFVERAARYFSKKQVIARKCDKTIARTTVGVTISRARKLATALEAMGSKKGDVIASLAWNHERHLELYLGVPCSGRVLQTLNIRLHPDEIAYIANHAGARVIVVDGTLLPVWEKVKPKAKSIEHVIVMLDGGATLPAGAIDYESLIDGEREAELPKLDENEAAMICYTSGTTGTSKGVVYSHRSLVLHTLVSCMPSVKSITERDVVMPVVPMFHANAWGLPFDALAVGSSLALPGPHLDPVSILDMMESEKVTFAAGVPTIWIGILAALDAEPKRWDLSALRSTLIGGSAAPPALIEAFEKRHGIEVLHAWGMTEMSPLGTVAHLRTDHDAMSDADKLATRASQGSATPFVETRHVDDRGNVLPWNGVAVGELEVRGPWVAERYIGDEAPEKFTADGWFKTGDVVSIDKLGYLRITDRSKDVIKSGGEWISSVALENALMSHPAVLEAAVFAAKSTKWNERPVAAIVFKKDQMATKEELLGHIEGRFPKYWTPDEVLFVNEIPRTSTGKFLKTKLRELYGDVLESK